MNYNQILIRRIKEYKDCTISKISLITSGDNLLMECCGLEPLKEGLERDKGFRVPAGKYGLMWHISKRFHQKLPLLHNMNVPSDRNILIHAGNYPSDSIGCILVGEEYKAYGDNQALVEKSNLALQKILSNLTKYSGKDLKDWIVNIKNEFEKEEE